MKKYYIFDLGGTPRTAWATYGNFPPEGVPAEHHMDVIRSGDVFPHAESWVFAISCTPHFFDYTNRFIEKA